MLPHYAQIYFLIQPKPFFFLHISNYSSLPAIGSRKGPEEKGPLTPKPSEILSVSGLLAFKKPVWVTFLNNAAYTTQTRSFGAGGF